MERQLTQESGNKLDSYEMEVLNERADVLKDLAEFQLAAVGGPGWQRWQQPLLWMCVLMPWQCLPHRMGEE